MVFLILPVYFAYVFGVALYGLKKSRDISKALIMRWLSGIGIFMTVALVVLLWLFVHVVAAMIELVFALGLLILFITYFIGAGRNRRRYLSRRE